MAHLDDLDLSAHLDGEADHGAHLVGCASCQARLASLGAVAAAVGAPVPSLDGPAADALIARALAQPGEQATPGEGVSHVVPLAGRATRSRRRPAWLAAAAVAVLALAAVPVIVRTAQDSGGSATAVKTAPTSGDPSLSEAADSAGSAASGTVAAPQFRADSGGAASMLAAEPVSGGDLGEQSDTAVVGARARDRLEGGAAEGQTDASPVSRCEAQARQSTPELAGLAYVAVLRWRGVQAEALVFRVPGDDAAYQLEVMAQQDCRRLAQARI